MADPNSQKILERNLRTRSSGFSTPSPSSNWQVSGGPLDIGRARGKKAMMASETDESSQADDTRAQRALANEERASALTSDDTGASLRTAADAGDFGTKTQRDLGAKDTRKTEPHLNREGDAGPYSFQRTQAASRADGRSDDTTSMTALYTEGAGDTALGRDDTSFTGDDDDDQTVRNHGDTKLREEIAELRRLIEHLSSGQQGSHSIPDEDCKKGQRRNRKRDKHGATIASYTPRLNYDNYYESGWSLSNNDTFLSSSSDSESSDDFYSSHGRNQYRPPSKQKDWGRHQDDPPPPRGPPRGPLKPPGPPDPSASPPLSPGNGGGGPGRRTSSREGAPPDWEGAWQPSHYQRDYSLEISDRVSRAPLAKIELSTKYTGADDRPATLRTWKRDVESYLKTMGLNPEAYAAIPYIHMALDGAAKEAYAEWREKMNRSWPQRSQNETMVEYPLSRVVRRFHRDYVSPTAHREAETKWNRIHQQRSDGSLRKISEVVAEIVQLSKDRRASSERDMTRKLYDAMDPRLLQHVHIYGGDPDSSSWSEMRGIARKAELIFNIQQSTALSQKLPPEQRMSNYEAATSGSTMNRMLRKATRNVSISAKQETTKETTEEDARTRKDDQREITQQSRSNAATSGSSPTRDTGNTSRQEPAAPRRHFTAKQEEQLKRGECFKCGEHGHLARECPGLELREAPRMSMMRYSNSDPEDEDTEEEDSEDEDSEYDD